MIASVTCLQLVVETSKQAVTVAAQSVFVGHFVAEEVYRCMYRD